MAGCLDKSRHSRSSFLPRPLPGRSPNGIDAAQDRKRKTAPPDVRLALQSIDFLGINFRFGSKRAGKLKAHH